MADQIDKSAPFKKWLALFFIQHSMYKITEKGYAELAPKKSRQYMEFAEVSSDREREERIERTYTLSKKEIKEAVAKKVETMLAEGKAEELYDNGYITKLGNFDWKDRKVRITVLKKLLEILGKSTREITEDDFNNNGLGGLLSHYYKGSPYLAMVEAGYAYSLDEIKEHARTMQFRNDKIYPWEMGQTSGLIYKEKENRIAATKWLIWKLKKEPREITADDFDNNGLSGLLARPEYKSSPYLALVDAGYAYSEDEIKEHARTGEFKTDKIYSWEMNQTSSLFYKKSENRTAATKWLVWKIGKETREITQDDFNNNGLRGLLDHHYKSSPYEALLEAGRVTPADEEYMRSSQHTH